jgi:mannose/cellobiose epimerase-like protein (N-acyl-D-glucosamine 2-epimerase family)
MNILTDNYKTAAMYPGKITACLLICGIILFSYPALSQQSGSGQDKKYLEGGFWRQQGLTQIIPFWQTHVRDTKYGAFYTYLSREGKPFPPWDKYPAMISRQVFGFTSAYLLSGNEKYLETASEGVNYLIKYAWDKEYGGWFDLLDRDGNPKATTKSVPNQLYTNVGLALYYFATGDSDVLTYINESIRIQKKYSFDNVNGGYYQTLSRDLSVSDSSKSKHSHYGYTSSLLINLMMITRDKEIGNFAEELMQISFRQMTDKDYGWFNGFPKPYDIRWNLTPSIVNNKEVVSAGAQLTATLSLLRLFEMTGDEIYRTKGINLGDQLLRSAWDSTSGGWFDIIDRKPPFKPQDKSSVSWWLQSYGMFVQLHLYHITGEKRYLDFYQKMASFWNNYFVDKEYGAVFQNVTPAGISLSTDKAVAWKASYHEMENALLNYLYLSLYVNSEPVNLYFHFKKSLSQTKHFVSIIEDPSVRIISVKINGKQWKSFDAAERSVILPAGKDIKLEVTLGNNPKH